jgi:hypothetical protein
MAEVSFGGVFLPAPLLWAGIAFVLSSVLGRLLSRTAFCGYIWHRALFDFTMFVMLWGIISEFAYRAAFSCVVCVDR